MIVEKNKILHCINFERHVTNRCGSDAGGLDYWNRTHATHLAPWWRKKFDGSETQDFCRKHNIALQLVPGRNHLLPCRVEGAIRIPQSHTRVPLKQSGCLLPFERMTYHFTKKRNTLLARKEVRGTSTTVSECMRPVGVSNHQRAIAVPLEWSTHDSDFT